MNVGGPAVLLSELIRNLPTEDFHHTLITGTCQSNEIDYLESHPLDSEVIYIDEITRSILPISDIKSFFKLIKVLRTLNPDIVHTHTSKAGVLGRLAARIGSPKAKVIHTYHGHLLYGYFPKWKTNLIVILERFLGRFTNIYVSVTNQVKNDLLKVGVSPESKWVVIRPGVTPGVALDKSEARRRLGIEPDKFVISWIGRFTDIKNPMLALKAFEELDKDSKAQLVMAGSGELFNECKEYSEKRSLSVQFLGWISEVNTLLAASDILLMSSKNEGMPVVIVEAAFKAVSTAATDVGGISEFISNMNTGILLRQDSSDISRHIVQLIKDPNLLRELSRRSQELAQEKFSVQNLVNEHGNLYKRLVSTG
jgi:glycosyltransferase involved in cell wall biosynthesis